MKPVTVIAYLKAKTGKTEALRAALLTLIKPSRADQGCRGYDLHQSADQPDQFVFYENWDSKALLEAHLAQPHLQAFLKQADNLLAEPPQITLWEKLS